MLGLEIKVLSETKESMIKILQEVITEIQNGATSMYIPLNDSDKTECDFSICITNGLSLYDNWDECCLCETTYRTLEVEET